MEKLITINPSLGMRTENNQVMIEIKYLIRKKFTNSWIYFFVCVLAPIKGSEFEGLPWWPGGTSMSLCNSLIYQALI